jgi:AbiV family abortive infection protein
MNNNLISSDDLLVGVYYCLKHAENFFNTGQHLYDKKEFQSSIPLLTISLEEALKGYILLRSFRDNKDLTNKDWEDLKRHQYKLTYLFKNLSDSSQNWDTKVIESMNTEMKDKIEKFPEYDKDSLIENLKLKDFYYSHFQELREACFYVDYNKLSKWIGFGENDKQKESLTYFLLQECIVTIFALRHAIETLVNEYRKKGDLTIELPFPKYSEYRDHKDFQSIEFINEHLRKLDSIKRELGMKMLTKFVKTNSLDQISNLVVSESFLNYYKVLNKQEHSDPHPLIKSLLIATYGSRFEPHGVYSGISYDYDFAPPRLYFSSIIEKKDQITISDLIWILNKEHRSLKDSFEQILRTEIVLEREEGKEVKLATYIEALNKIGIRSKEIKERDLEDAINFTKKLIAENSLSSITQKTIDEINSIHETNDFNQLSSTSRSIIASTYGMNQYPGYQVYFTPSEKINKTEARFHILEVLTKEHIRST